MVMVKLTLCVTPRESISHKLKVELVIATKQKGKDKVLVHTVSKFERHVFIINKCIFMHKSML